MATAIYWPQRTVPFSPEMLSVEFIDSPLAGRLKTVAGPDCYIKFAAHLYALPKGLRRPLATVSQPKAWRFLNEVDADLIREFRDALEAGLTAHA